MEFRLLGSLEAVHDDGRPVPLRGAKQRALLAMLLVRANEVVSRDRLIEELWPGRPPGSAAHSLDIQVSRLRKALGRDDLLATRPGGYVLSVEPEAIDARRFERGLEIGRQANADGEPSAALEALDAALGLWRGDALSDLGYEELARTEIDRLEELRLVAVEQRIEAELALGRHDALVPELEALVAKQPLRERLRGQLMLALYRSRRQADALAAYQDARHALAEQLGLQPGRDLQRLERAVLQHDPGLDLQPLPSPTRLPAPVSSFVGRTREIGDLERLILRADARLVTITGVGGVGKTRLALALGERLRDAYPDGVFFIPLVAVRDPEGVAATLADAVGAVAAPREPVGDALDRWLQGRTALLVLDNFEHLLDAAPLLPDLLSRTRTVKVLTTSREPLRATGEHLFTLGPLTELEAEELFVERAFAARSDFRPGEDISEICRRLDRLPLAIELAAARVNALSLPLIVARLDKRLPFLTYGPRDAPLRQQTLRNTIEWSYDLLTPAEQRLFVSLGVFAGGCSLEAAESVCDADVETLASLVNKSLVRRVGERYGMLQTVREYATERLEQLGEQDAAMQRLAEYLVTLAEGSPADVLITSPRVLELGQELDNLRAAFAWALDKRQLELALRLASEAYWFASGNGNLLAEQSRWLDGALACATSAPVVLRAYALTIRAQVAYDLGHFELAEALAVSSLDLYRETDNHSGTINVLRGLGTIARALGDRTQARGWYEESLALADRMSDVQKVSYALKSLGDLERELGNLDEAAALLDRSAFLAREAGDRMILAYILHGAGDVALAAGDTARAADSYREAARLSHEFGLWRPVVHCVAGLAAVAADAGDAARAGKLWGAREALERELGWRVLPHERAQYDGGVTACLDAAPLAFESGAERGRTMTPIGVLECALETTEHVI